MDRHSRARSAGAGLRVQFGVGCAGATGSAYRQAAESLGAGPVRVLLRITLPLLVPALGAAAGLSVALSMGELGATIMVYPATWKTLPVAIFGLTDRGQVFQAAANTTLLLLVTLVALLALGRIRNRR